jgi:hypothetical protein
MDEPTTVAGRRFVERHGTGKQLEILDIEAEARAEAERLLRIAVEQLREFRGEYLSDEWLAQFDTVGRH